MTIRDDNGYPEPLKRRPKSVSALSRILSSDNHGNKGSCVWLFEFTIDTGERTFVFRCATHEDRAYWVRVLKLIDYINNYHSNIITKNSFF